MALVTFKVPMPITKSYKSLINYGGYTRRKSQSSHWLGEAKYSQGRACTKHEITLEAQVLDQEDCHKGKSNFLVGCLCMFLFHHANMVEM